MIMRMGWIALLSITAGAAGGLPVEAGEITEKRVSEGHRVYQLTCSVCHGDKGDGKTWATRALNPSPENFTEDPEHFNMEELMEHIAEGCHNTAMQPFKYQLYVEDIEDVSAHILVNLLGWTVAEVNADLMGEDHTRDDHGSHDEGHGDEQAHADEEPHDHDSHADGSGCTPWDLEGAKTVAIKGRRP